MSKLYKDKDWLYDQYWNKKKTLKEIGKICNVGRSCIHSWMKRFNIPRRSIEEINKEKDWNGENNPRWNGGKRETNGYVFIYKLDHPRKKKDSYIQEHILTMEEFLGRYLDEKECIHHINLIKNDNRIENLCLFKNNSSHQKVKRSLNSVVSDLVNKGIIKFNKEKKVYYHKD